MPVTALRPSEPVCNKGSTLKSSGSRSFTTRFRIHNISILEQAYKVTELWDFLVGQKLNTNKSVVWGTSANARKRAKQTFPDMCLKLEFDVLGSQIHTTNRAVCPFPEEKIAKIVADARNIAALLLPRADKVKLIGMKVVPQCTYAAGFNSISKHSVGKIQTEIVHILWQNRPPWRARWLVLAFLGQPHRTEPVIARAYNTIMDFLRFLLRNQECKSILVDLLNAPFDTRYGLIPKVKLACECFGLTLHADLTISWGHSPKVAIEELSPKDIKKTLQVLAANATYQKCADTKRKDLSKPQGILDLDLTTLFHRKSKLQTNAPFSTVALYENQLVGAAPTKDRLCAAKIMEDADCRFCCQAKESMHHFLECSFVREKIGSVPSHDLGPNFSILGIVEHPRKIAEYRLRCTSIPECPSAPFDPTPVHKCLWTDGSLVWNEIYWLEAGGYCIVDQDANIVSKGPVQHWHLSSYTTELYALLTAIFSYHVPLKIFTDCQTVVKQFRQPKETKVIDHWSHPSWWNAILHQLQQRSHRHTDPIQVVWIPAHLYEHLPIEVITEEWAEAKGTTRQHIHLNRVADKHARSCAHQQAAVAPDDQSWLYSAILAKQNWLTKLADLIYCDYQALQRKVQANERVENQHDRILSERECREIFPDMLWEDKQNDYKWRPQRVEDLPKPKETQIAHVAWETYVSFLCSLKWKEGPELSISFVELAFLFCIRGNRIPEREPATTTFRELTTELRKAMLFLKNNTAQSLFPGDWQRSQNRSYGKSLPAGCIVGATPWFSNNELRAFANVLHRGAGKNLSTWAWFLDDERLSI